MGSKGNFYASTSIQQIGFNVHGGLFGYTNGLLSSTQNVIYRYQTNNDYQVEYTGQKRVAGNIQTANGIAFLGEFSSQYALEDAFDAYVGFAWNRAFRAETQNDYYGMLAFLDGHQFNEAAWGFRGAYDIVNIWKLSIQSNGNSVSSEKPCYTDLISGYYLDARDFPSIKQLIPPQSKQLKIGYYRQNVTEGIDGLISIDWYHYDIELIKGKPIYLPINRPVLGTLWVDDPVIEGLIKAMPHLPTEYPVSVYFPSDVPGLFNYWQSLYAIEEAKPSPIGVGNLIGQFESNLVSSTVKILGANNNVWNNATAINDVGFDLNHPMFEVDDQRAYDWHIKPVSKGIGSLIMDSPRTIEIHTALDAGTWGINPDDPLTPRVDNLGWRTARTNEVLGIRVKTDGTIDKASEDKLVRQVIAKDKVLDPKKVGVNGFGDEGMVLKRISNRFNKDEIVSDQCVIVHDIPQKLDEYFDQINLALGIQESSAVQIVAGDKVARFNNQLEILVELVHLLSSMNEMTRSNLVSSLVTQSQSNEIIGGLGLPSVTKTIPIKIGKSVSQLPFKGIAAHRSISQEIATCTYNVGLVTGQLL
jgi:hypothetical protein